MLALLVSVALAKSPCKVLKPHEKVSPEALKVVDQLLQTALSATRAAVVGGLKPSQLLPEGDNSARSWFLYQVCALRESGTISQEKSDELVGAVLGSGEPATDTATLIPPAPEGLSPQLAQQRAQIVYAVNTVCSMKGMEASCEAYKTMLAQFDAAVRR